MQDLTKTTLELFVEKTNELIKEEFTQFLQEFGHSLNISLISETQEITTVAPTETMNKSFLLTYRMFLQRNENMGFINPMEPISKVLLDPSLSPEWLTQVQEVTQYIHTYLGKLPMIQMRFTLIDEQGNQRDETPTRWIILETLLYGHYAHSSQRKRLNNWLSTPFFKDQLMSYLMMEFKDILAVTLKGIIYLSHLAQIELDSEAK